MAVAAMVSGVGRAPRVTALFAEDNELRLLRLSAARTAAQNQSQAKHRTRFTHPSPPLSSPHRTAAPQQPLYANYARHSAVQLPDPQLAALA